jgi:hypothetical protein
MNAKLSENLGNVIEVALKRHAKIELEIRNLSEFLSPSPNLLISCTPK